MGYFSISPYVDTPYSIEYTSTNGLTGVTGADLIYEKPDGVTGVTGLTVQDNSFLIDIPASINDLNGLWRMQPRAYFAGDTEPSLWSAFTVYVRKLFK
jgi:hypothetical protein